MVAVVRRGGGEGGGGGRTQRDRRQPWFGAEPEEGLWLMESGGTGERGREGEEERRRKFGDGNAEIQMNDRGEEEAALAMNELKEQKEATANGRDMKLLKCGEARGKEEERGREGERGKGVGGVVSYELAAGGMPGLWGGEEEEEAEEEGGGSLTSARLEPQWLARIQPHSAFDEGWILKLNQSHMSPTERERETERPKDWERETEGVV